MPDSLSNFRKGPEKRPQYQYLFSIIVPTYNRPKPLRRCFQGINLLSYPRNRFEVILIDDGSSTPIDHIVRPYQDSLNLRFIRLPHCGKSAAVNHAVNVAKGRFLAFTDDDCWPDVNWLHKLEFQFKKTPDCLIGGKTINGLPHNRYSTASQVIIDAVYTYFNEKPEHARFIAGNNMALSKELFLKLGGYNAKFMLTGEDREFCYRWVERGGSIRYIPETYIYHGHELNFRGYCRQHFNYGRSSSQFQKLRLEKKAGRLFDDIRFHRQLGKLLQRPLQRLTVKQKYSVIMLLFAWQIVYILGFLYQKYVPTDQPSNSINGNVF